MITKPASRKIADPKTGMLSSEWEIKLSELFDAVNTAGISQSWGVISAGAAGWGTTSATEAALVTVPILANTLGANGVVRVTTTWSFTGTASKTPRIRFGASGAGTSGTQMWGAAITANTVQRNLTVFQNRNDASSQVTFVNTATSYGATTGSLITAAINTTNASEVCITGVTDGTDTLTLEAYIVELCYYG